MKNTRKYLLSFVMLLIMVFAVQASAANEVQMTASTNTSITIKWKPKTSAVSPTIGYAIYDAYGYLLDAVSGENTTTYTFTGLNPGIAECIYVYTVRRNASTGKAEKYSQVGYTYVNTTPTSVTSFTPDTYKKQLYLDAYVPARATGVQFEITDLKTKKKVYKNCGGSATCSITQDRAYSIRVRSYYKNPSNGQSYCSAWSAVKYADSPTVSGKSTSNKAGFSLTLKKATGVKNYTVYVSKSNNGGYQKTTTVTVTGKSKTVRITKMGSAKLKKGTYYIRIVPNIVVGKTVVASSTYYEGRIKVFK